VIVDDYVPVDPKTGKAAFARSRGDEIWMCLLEKAWAKLHGSYCMIVSGGADKVFPSLTNKPTIYINLKSKDEQIGNEALWTKMKQALQM
jgi:hypothetical protein